MRLTPLEWGLRTPITPRLGGNRWALPRLGKSELNEEKQTTQNTKLRILPRKSSPLAISSHCKNPQSRRDPNAVANMGSGSGIPQVKELWEVRCVRLEDFDASVAANFHQSTLRPQAVILG